MTRLDPFASLPFVCEMCPHCGEDVITTGWDISVHGFKATCPYCGDKLMLCAECQNGDELRFCDWNNETNTCHMERIKQEWK